MLFAQLRCVVRHGDVSGSRDSKRLGEDRISLQPTMASSSKVRGPTGHKDRA